MGKVSRTELLIQDIYAAYYNRMLLWAKRYFPEKADCEDAVQESFLRLLKRPDLVQQAGDGARLEGLLRIVLRTVCLDQIKKRRYEIPADPEEFGELGSRRDEWTEDRFAEKDALHRAIAELTPTIRDVLILAYLYGYSTGEIAKLTDKKTSTVRKSLTRAKKALYNLLKEEKA